MSSSRPWLQQLLADRLGTGEDTEDEGEHRRLHVGHASVDIAAASVAVVGVLGLGHRHQSARRRRRAMRAIRSAP